MIAERMPDWSLTVADYYCPDCDEVIDNDRINIREGVAWCATCERLIPLAELVDFDVPASQVLEETPRGCSLAEDGRQLVVRATVRSWGRLVGIMFFFLFWNRIVGVFLCGLAGVLYGHLVGPLPDWFPEIKGEDGEPMTLGMAAGMALFMIPFVLIGAFLTWLVTMHIAGHVRVVLEPENAHVTTGIGPLVWRKRFDPRRVSEVSYDMTPWETNGHPSRLLRIKADRTVKFGSLLREERGSNGWPKSCPICCSTRIRRAANEYGRSLGKAPTGSSERRRGRLERTNRPCA